MKTYKCGCLGDAFQMCGTHAAAPDMLSTLKRMRNTFGLITQGMPKKFSKIAQSLSMAAEEMNEAITKAEKK